MRSILVKLPAELKEKLEQHPRHHYGSCNDFYVDVIRIVVESPQFKLDLANGRLKRLERKIEWLEKELRFKAQSLETWKRIAAAKTSSAA